MTTLNVLYIWRKGTLIHTSLLEKRSLTLSGSEDADIPLTPLGETALFITPKEQFFQIYTMESGQRKKQHDVGFGELFTLKDINLVILKTEKTVYENQRSGEEQKSLNIDFIEEIIAWSQNMSSSGATVKSVCEGFLDIIMQKSQAQNGFIVLNPEGIPEILAAQKIDIRGAFRALEHLPPSMLKDIIKNGTTVLLPEEIKTETKAFTTIFIKGLQSVAGFPIVINHKVLGIIYLGFKNILRELESSLQKDLEKIASLVGLLLKQAILRSEIQLTNQTATPPSSLEKGRILVGESPEMSELYRSIEKVAAIPIPVFIFGETGTGKELVAKEIHRYSPREKKNFIPINCAAIPENLVEGLLFGHKKGAFTGAMTDSPGLIEQAHQGTLFLDEIADLPMQMQIKLLRVLQEKKVRRVGETQERSVDFRLISASHKDLKALSEKELFRIDLYYRVAGATIETPPLKNRLGDLILLAETFKKRFCQQNNLPQKAFSEDALKVMAEYPWPGNVRELEHVVARASVMADAESINPNDLGIF